MSAQDLGWGPPGGLGPDDLVMLDIEGPYPWHVRREASLVFSELVRWLRLARRAYGVPPLSAVGAYNPRKISGTDSWSNHAWGLAGDCNAGTNPYAWNAPVDMPPGTSAKAKSLGMRWGGDYTGKRDGMHFEVVVSPKRLAELSADLRMELGARLLREGLFGSDVTALQVLLGLLPDGYFGPKTEAAVKEVQDRLHTAVDGIVGAVTLAGLRGTAVPDVGEPAAPPAPPVEVVIKPPTYDYLPYDFPYPGGHYLGLESPDPAAHSGFHAKDRERIAVWQRGMRARGWTIAVDGRFGPATHEVVCAFQKEKRLYVDGRVGAVTWHATDVSPTK